ncbi:uncharacterized protein [Rutidosis leptorrhynchoides]|uniref:uncharacterized protein n=1 Tax=Rutidosis leptorrhynchoides TaxID=125765 RepID=UPI003A9971ED
MNWRRCNATVWGWLVSAVEKDIKSSVKYAITAPDIWVDLEERFGKENAPQEYELRRTITMIFQENMIVSSYYTSLRGLWDEIAFVSPTPTCKRNGCTWDLAKEILKMQDKERLYDFLMSLNEQYNTVRTQILSNTTLLIVGVAEMSRSY